MLKPQGELEIFGCIGSLGLITIMRDWLNIHKNVFKKMQYVKSKKDPALVCNIGQTRSNMKWVKNDGFL